MHISIRVDFAGGFIPAMVYGLLGALLSTDAASAQERIVVEPAGRVSWTQLVAAEMMRPSEVVKAPRVIRKPAPLPDEIREIDPELIRPDFELDDAPQRDEAPALRAGERGLIDLSLGDNFQAMPDNNRAIPPDTMGAAGPDHLMTMLNSEVGVQSRDGSRLTRVSLSTFWTVGTGLSGDPFDPVLLYDHLSDRWIAACVADAFSSTSAVFFAISDTSDPTGMWSFFEFEADPDGGLWVDFPGFGANGVWIAVTGNMFTLSGSFGGVKMWAIDKSTALADGALTVTVFDPGFDASGGVDGFSLRPALTFDAAEPDLFIVDNSGFTASGTPLIRLSRLTGPGASPEWLALPGAFSGPNADSGLYPVVNDFSFNLNDAAQAGTTTRVATNDFRIASAVFRNGRLWAAHAGGLPDGAVDRTASFWYEYDPALTSPLVQTGVVSGGADSHFFFPSISVNSADDMALGFSFSDPITFVEGAFTGRLAADAPGSTRPVATLKAGEDAYVKTFGGQGVRWGDYSATVVDPVDDLSFWTIQQYAETDVGGSASNDRWGTWWGRVGVAEPCPTDFTGDGVTDGADLGVLLGAWGGPQADLTGDNATDGADLGVLLGAWGPCN